jgi:hypothetical protein
MTKKSVIEIPDTKAVTNPAITTTAMVSNFIAKPTIIIKIPINGR